MNKLTFLLATSALIISSCAQKQPKRTQMAGPLEITAVNTEYQAWQYRDASITGWGVTVHVVNTTDRTVAENIEPARLQITNDSAKHYSLPDDFSKVCTMINLGQLRAQGYAGEFFKLSTGTAVKISDSSSDVGMLVGIRDKNTRKFNLQLQLSPKKSVTLVFVFDAPKESKPKTLNWPTAKAIELQ